MKYVKKVTRLAAFSTMLIFFMSLLAGFPVSNAQAAESSIEISIPKNFGTVEKVFEGQSAFPLIYIQDAHNSFEAQENIARIIDHLTGKYGIRKVLSEGYEGPMPLDQLYPFEDKEVRETVSRHSMDYLRLSGAQYAYVNRRHPFNLIGIDDLDLYLANLKAYEQSAKNRETISQDLRAISRELSALGDRIYPKEIKEWLKLKSRLSGREINLADYLFRVFRFYHGKNAALDSKKFPRLALVSKSLSKNRISEEELSKINEELERLESLAFFTELEAFENSFAERFLTDSRSKELFYYQKSVDLLNRLNLFSITPQEYVQIKSSLLDLKTEKLASFLANNLKRSVVIKKEWESLIAWSLWFYELAKLRDDVFTKRIPASEPAILVTGGFHKQPVLDYLEKHRISYVVISPRISGDDPVHQERYDFLMSGKRFDFEKPFALLDPLSFAAQQKTDPVLELELDNVVPRNIHIARRLFPSRDVVSEEVALAASLGSNIRQLAEAALQQKQITQDTRNNLIAWSDPSYDVEIGGIRVHEQIIDWFVTKNFDALNIAFGDEVKPGTAGVRGVLGLGSNRINAVTLGRFVEAHARHLENVWAGKVEGKNINTKSTRKAVILAYDSREGSYDPATNGPGYLVKQAAGIYAAHGFEVDVFDGPAPTPELSFAVQHFRYLAGAVFTASHNPANNNGFKPYDETGQQLLNEDADGLKKEIQGLVSFKEVKRVDYDEALKSGQIKIVGPKIDSVYIERLLQYGIKINPDLTYDRKTLDVDSLRVAFTPLHGTSGRTVPAMLLRRGFNMDHLFIVKEQMNPDGKFPTAAKPNPEEDKALRLLIALAIEQNADIAAANDPDADRVAVLVKKDKNKRGSEENYFKLNGNKQMAVIADYILARLTEDRNLPENSVLWKSLVSSDALSVIGESYDVPTVESRVGFKFAGGKMKEYVNAVIETLKENPDFAAQYAVFDRGLREKFLKSFSRVLLLGGEESYGANRGDIVRDKDGPAMIDMFVEIAAYWKKQRSGIYERLFGKGGIFDTYGYFEEQTANYPLSQDPDQLKKEKSAIMKFFTETPPTKISGKNVAAVLDFQNQTAKDLRGNVLFDGNFKNPDTPGRFKLPQVQLANGRDFFVHTFNDLDGKNVGKEDFLEFILNDGSRIIIRPSGTEPVIKLYVLARGAYANREAIDHWVNETKVELSKIADARKAAAASLGTTAETPEPEMFPADVPAPERENIILEKVRDDLESLRDQPVLVIFRQDEYPLYGEKVQREFISDLIERKIMFLVTHVEDPLSLPKDLVDRLGKSVITVKGEITTESLNHDQIKKLWSTRKFIYLSNKLSSPELVRNQLAADQKSKALFVRQPKNVHGVLTAALLLASDDPIYKGAFEEDDSGFLVVKNIWILNLVREYLAQRVTAIAA